MRPLLLILLATIFASAAQLLYKFGSAGFSLVWILSGFVLYCVAGLLVVLAFREGELSRVFPIFASTFVWVALLSLFFFKESLSSINWLGIVLIVIGVSVVSR